MRMERGKGTNKGAENMKNKTGWKILATSVAVVMVISGITPCIALDNNSTNNALNHSTENLLRKAFTEKSFAEMMTHFDYPLAHEMMGEEVNNCGVHYTTSGSEIIELLWELPVDTHIRDIAFGDIDGDGMSDVVASVLDWGSIGWSVVGIKGNSGAVL